MLERLQMMKWLLGKEVHQCVFLIGSLSVTFLKVSATNRQRSVRGLQPGSTCKLCFFATSKVST